MRSARAALFATAFAVSVLSAGGTPRSVRGILTGITLNPDGSGTVACGRQSFVVPAHVRVEFPGASLSLPEVFALAPAECRVTGESGLLAGDRCRARRHSRRVVHVVGDVLTERGISSLERLVIAGADERVSGPVTFIHTLDGYLRVGGEYGVDAHGRVLRINDPAGRISIQQGAACGAEGNCSPDVRFAFDATAPSVRFGSGGFACVPSSASADGFCPPGASHQRGAVLQAVRLGDHVVARGGQETLGASEVFVAHTLIVDQR
jgi:hypothetical protein